MKLNLNHDGRNVAGILGITQDRANELSDSVERIVSGKTITVPNIIEAAVESCNTAEELAYLMYVAGRTF